MKKSIMFITVVTLLSFAVSNEALAQQGMMWKGGGGWGPETPCARCSTLRLLKASPERSFQSVKSPIL